MRVSTSTVTGAINCSAPSSCSVPATEEPSRAEPPLPLRTHQHLLPRSTASLTPVAVRPSTAAINAVRKEARVARASPTEEKATRFNARVVVPGGGRAGARLRRRLGLSPSSTGQHARARGGYIRLVGSRSDRRHAGVIVIVVSTPVAAVQTRGLHQGTRRALLDFYP